MKIEKIDIIQKDNTIALRGLVFKPNGEVMDVSRVIETYKFSNLEDATIAYQVACAVKRFIG